MSNKPVIPQEYQMSEASLGFAFGEWTSFAKQVDEGYERFWAKRGGVPNKTLIKNFQREEQEKGKKRRD